MSKKGIDQRHSETALFAALYRAIAHKEFGDKRLGQDHLAEYFLPPHFRFLIRFKKVRINVIKKSNRLTPGMYEYMLARTVFFDSLFEDGLKNNVSQIVLLGAGYDTRPYRFKKLNSNTKIIELDVATTQDRKRKCLKRAHIVIPKNVSLVTIDFNKESLKDVLEKAGYEANQKTLFLWEGVCYYLDPESVYETLEFFKRFSHNKSLIAFDYAVFISEENIENYYGARKFMETWRKHRSNEPFKFTIDEDQTETLLEQRGLKVVSHLENKEMEKNFLLNEDGSLIGRINGMFCFVSASPNKE
jgi:methyltransferase (TIGR00027 family)